LTRIVPHESAYLAAPYCIFQLLKRREAPRGARNRARKLRYDVTPLGVG
jgi:hypothetical protein